MKKITIIVVALLLGAFAANAQPKAIGIRGFFSQWQLSYEHYLGDPNFLEFFSASVSKAEALRKVAGMCHVPVCETAAIGDAGNDIPMLKEAGIGIAMGNATEETKTQADAVTLDNEHDGVAYALKNICKMI